MESTKSQIYNLIILDESGSMDCVCKQTIAGCNETINTIKSAQNKYADTQEHYVSIFAFQSNGERSSRYIIKNVAASEVKHITTQDYEPWGSTPLYDAVGSTLTDLESTTHNNDNATASVTIITDGMENSSRHYSLAKVASMIDAFKEMGWNFNFIGANIDVERVSRSLNIDNALAFEQDDEGTQKMFDKTNNSRMAYYDRVDIAEKNVMCCRMAPHMSPEEITKARKERRRLNLKKASKDFFEK